MYVCVCNAINTRAIATAIDDGASSVAQVYKAVGALPQCGKCKQYIRSMLDERATNAGSTLAKDVVAEV